MAEHIDEQASVEYYNRLPGITVGSGVLIFNTLGHLLLVKPDYRNTWSWPGGGRDPSESPLRTAARECLEEIGACPDPLRPAFINYIPHQPNGRADTIHFVYEAGPVDDDFINGLTPQSGEIEEIRFVPSEKWSEYMKAYRVRAVQTYLEHRIAGAMLELEDGILPELRGNFPALDQP